MTNQGNKSRVLGIDPGLRITGYAVLEKTSQGIRLLEGGILSTKEAGKNLAARLQVLYAGLQEILDLFKPGAMAVEQLFVHYKHPRTAILMGHARGVLLLGAGQHGIPVTSYNPTRIKKTLTGNGRAPKIQMQMAIQRELALKTLPDPPDVADAMAVALTHLYALVLDRQEQE